MRRLDYLAAASAPVPAPGAPHCPGSLWRRSLRIPCETPLLVDLPGADVDLAIGVGGAAGMVRILGDLGAAAGGMRKERRGSGLGSGSSIHAPIPTMAMRLPKGTRNLSGS